MMSGMKLALFNQTVMKNCPTLGRDAEYKKDSHITRLPSYLTVSFFRFFYKVEQKESCKVLKDVKFPMQLDVFELCAPALQVCYFHSKIFRSIYFLKFMLAGCPGAGAHGVPKVYRLSY